MRRDGNATNTVDGQHHQHPDQDFFYTSTNFILEMATTYVKHCISLVLISVITFGTFFVGFPGLLVVKSRTSRVTEVFDNEYDHADNYLLVFGDSRDWHIWHDWCISAASSGSPLAAQATGHRRTHHMPQFVRRRRRGLFRAHARQSS